MVSHEAFDAVYWFSLRRPLQQYSTGASASEVPEGGGARDCTRAGVVDVDSVSEISTSVSKPVYSTYRAV